MFMRDETPRSCPACESLFVTETLYEWVCADCGATKKIPYGRPDYIMEKAKQKAGSTPDKQVRVDLSAKEEFLVTYSLDKDTFDCTRRAKQ
jgi:hypothetical protein